MKQPNDVYNYLRYGAAITHDAADKQLGPEHNRPTQLTMIYDILNKVRQVVCRSQKSRGTPPASACAVVSHYSSTSTLNVCTSPCEIDNFVDVRLVPTEASRVPLSRSVPRVKMVKLSSVRSITTIEYLLEGRAHSLSGETVPPSFRSRLLNYFSVSRLVLHDI